MTPDGHRLSTCLSDETSTSSRAAILRVLKTGAGTLITGAFNPLEYGDVGVHQEVTATETETLRLGTSGHEHDEPGAPSTFLRRRCSLRRSRTLFDGASGRTCGRRGATCLPYDTCIRGPLGTPAAAVGQRHVAVRSVGAFRPAMPRHFWNCGGGRSGVG